MKEIDLIEASDNQDISNSMSENWGQIGYDDKSLIINFNSNTFFKIHETIRFVFPENAEMDLGMDTYYPEEGYLTPREMVIKIWREEGEKQLIEYSLKCDFEMNGFLESEAQEERENQEWITRSIR